MENYIIKKDNGISYLQFIKLLEYEEIVKHAISLRPIDIGSNDRVTDEILSNQICTGEYCKCLSQQPIIEDYKKLCNALKLDYKNIYRPYQTHTDIVKCIENEEAGIFTKDFKDVDAIVTNKKNKILSISIADCIDIIFFDPVKKVIANTHSGWQGTYKLISKKTVENMVDNYECNPKDIICCIGPSIRKCHFEVDEELSLKFYEKFKYLRNINEIISEGSKENNKQKYNIDTVLINKETMLRMGLKEDNIIDCGLCTVCNSDKFHSYRVDKEKSGRNTGIICMCNTNAYNE